MKKILISVVIFIIALSPAFSQTIESLQKDLKNFSDAMSYSLPFSTTIGLNWSDAYIGNFPHFGVGLSVGFTTIDTDAIDKLFNQFRISLPLDSDYSLPLPAYTLEARLGGFVLPFDLGFKIGYLPIEVEFLNIDYFLVGGDVRFGIIDTEIFKFSAAAGYNYLQGGLGIKGNKTQEFDFDGEKLTIRNPDVGLLWKTNTLDIKAQASLSLKIITLYAGLGVSYAWSQAGYEITADNNLNLSAEAIKILKDKYDIDATRRGISSIDEVNFVSTRVFGGISFNSKPIFTDITLLFNFLDQKYGTSVGVRLQL